MDEKRKKVEKLASSNLFENVHWIIGQKTYVKKKITCFLKNYVASGFTFFEKIQAICEFRFSHINKTNYILLY